ncbi:MAG: DUF2721 domain-containing protein [Thermoplasmatota archaeon]
MALPDSVAVIQATLAPAFLISGASIFLNFSQTRLFRVLDRSRALAKDGNAAARPDLLRRARLLRNALALGVATVAFTVITAILVMASELFSLGGLAGAAPYAFALALLAFFAAVALAMWDTVLSVRSVERERA